MTAANRVLVVDDYEPNVAMARDILAAEYVTEEAASGEEALERYDTFRPDHLLLDVALPGMSGLEVCRQIREEREAQNVKIILVTASVTLADRLRGYEAGADDYLTKPYDPGELLAKLRVYARLKAVEDELRLANRKLAEQVRTRSDQLQMAEPLAMVGRHAAGLVHNLNNPLAGILGYAQLLERENPGSRYTASLLDAAQQMQSIIASLLGALRRGPEASERVLRLDEVIRQQVELLRLDRFFKNKVACDLEMPEAIHVQGVPHHFAQVVGNVLKNAVDAMHDSAERRLRVRAYAEETLSVVEIEDSGCGMTPEQVERIFDPFFTTKPPVAEPGEPVGTGLGLATCREIVGSYHGTVEVDSSPGEGTVFRLAFPAASRSNGSGGSDAPRYAASAGAA